MKVKIFSREASRKAHPSEKHIWISIRDTGERPVKLPKNTNRIAALFLEFDDVEKEGMSFLGRPLNAMSEIDAKKIVVFVMKYKADIELICVNCEAGISRSAGTAEAISLWLNEHDSGIRGNPQYAPNTWVKTRILRQLMNKDEQSS